MATLEQIRDALDTALEALDLRPVQELDKAVNASANAPAAMVSFAGADYLNVLNSQGDFLTFKVTTLVGRVSERAARQKLDALVDPSPSSTTSLRNGLAGNLGGVVAYLNVASASEYRNYPVGDLEYLGCEFTLQVAT